MQLIDSIEPVLVSKISSDVVEFNHEDNSDKSKVVVCFFSIKFILFLKPKIIRYRVSVFVP